MIKIIGGTKKNTSINIPHKSVRPTSIHKRKSIFSIIDSYSLNKNINIYKEGIVLDLFSGSGALGLESMSRGSSFGYFYENNIEVINCLKNNCLKLFSTKEFEIKNKNVLSSIFYEINKKISLIFMDPPYDINPFEKILNNIYETSILSKNALIILEYSDKSNINIPSQFFCIKEKKYRKTKISFIIKNIN